MEEEDLDFSIPEVFSGPTNSMDNIFDEILRDTHGCTHTHICNPPNSDLPHTHTCYHVHHKIFSPSADETESAESADKNAPKKRSKGNRVAVKKYREKKKARAASLEEEVAQLRAVNQQLMKRLQGQAALEAEVARLRCLLVDIRGRIEGEIGSFPYQKPMVQGNLMGGGGGGGAHIMNSCGDLLRCDDRLYGQGCGPCGNIQCMGSSSTGAKEVFVCGSAGGNGNGLAVGCSANGDKIIGGTMNLTKKLL